MNFPEEIGSWAHIKKAVCYAVDSYHIVFVRLSMTILSHSRLCSVLQRGKLPSQCVLLHLIAYVLTNRLHSRLVKCTGTRCVDQNCLDLFKKNVGQIVKMVADGRHGNVKKLIVLFPKLVSTS